MACLELQSVYLIHYGTSNTGASPANFQGHFGTFGKISAQFKCICYLPCLEGFSTFGMICFSNLLFKRVDFNRFVYFPAIVIDLHVENLYFLKSHNLKKNILKDILHLFIVILVPSWNLFLTLFMLMIKPFKPLPSCVLHLLENNLLVVITPTGLKVVCWKDRPILYDFPKRDVYGENGIHSCVIYFLAPKGIAE